MRISLSWFFSGLLGACIYIAHITPFPCAQAEEISDRSFTPQAEDLIKNILPHPAAFHIEQGMKVPLPTTLQVEWKITPTPLMQRVRENFEKRVKLLGSAGSRRFSLPLILDITHDSGFLTLQQKETYQLSLTKEGFFLSAAGEEGLIHGLQTLYQILFNAAHYSPSSMQHLPFFTLHDYPRFAWRGIMIDVARHFFSVADLKRQIEAMSTVKLNVLHLHLNDGQSFRLQSQNFPKLAQGEYYTHAQITDLIDYAAERGIRVVPEIDTPSHSLAIIRAYPELGAQSLSHFDGKDENRPALNPTLPETYQFVKALYLETGRLFPDAFFHAGGDEVNPKEWMSSPEITTFMQTHHIDTTLNLQAYFTRILYTALEDQSKTMIGWDEMTDFNLPPDVVIQSWQSSKFVAYAAHARHRVIVSSGYYLDLLWPARDHYKIDPFDPQAVGLSPEWADQAPHFMKSFIAGFIEDPHTHLTAAEEHYVLGGEAALWTELVTPTMLDSRLWPRAGAIAERLWSPLSTLHEDDLYARLHTLLMNLRYNGLQDMAARQHLIQQLTTTSSSYNAVETLLSICSPARNYVLNLKEKPIRQRAENSLAALAWPDNFTAINFNQHAHDFSEMVSRKATKNALLEQKNILIAQLKKWQANYAAFAEAASSNPVIARALPTAYAIKILSHLGIKALEETPLTLSSEEKTLLHRYQDYEKASANMVSAYIRTQPPSSLLIDILPGIEALISTRISKL